MIKVVTEAHLGGFLKLQAENQTAQGGSLSAEIKPGQSKEMRSYMPQIVVVAKGEVVFLLTTSQAFN